MSPAISKYPMTLLLFLVLLSSCSRFPLPPDQKQIDALSKDQKAASTKEEIWAYYALKTHSAEHRCYGWRELLRHDFPLTELVEIELLKCQDQNLTAEELNHQIQNLRTGISSWIEEHLAQSFIEHEEINLITKTQLKLMSVDHLRTREERTDVLLTLYQEWHQEENIREGHPTLYKELKQELIRQAPRFTEKVTPENILSVARDFERVREFDKAKNLYQKVIQSKNTNFRKKLQAHQRISQTYRLQREMDRYTQYTQTIASFVERSYRQTPRSSEIQEEWYSRQEASFRAIWTQNKTQEALDKTLAFFKKEREGLTSDQQAKLLWLAGLMSKELGKQQQANSFLKRATEFEISEETLQENIHWSYFWELYQNQKDEALSYLGRIERVEFSSSFLARLLFWKGQITRNKDDFIAAHKASPLSYYGLMSGLHGQKGQIPSLEREIPVIKKVPEMEWLLLLEKKDLAKHYLHWINENELSREQQRDTLHYFHRVGEYDQAIRRYYRVIDPENDKYRQLFLPALYPTPWTEEVQAAAKRFQVPPSLIYSVTRQESAFDDKARSWADAFGLMQLIPERAESLARRYDLPYSHYTDLYQPALNLSMGAALLKQLKEKYEDNLVLLLAAYNAGERPVNHWIETRYRENMVEFIEEIPYRETRQYVQHIIRNYLIYRGLGLDLNELDLNFLLASLPSKSD